MVKRDNLREKLYDILTIALYILAALALAALAVMGKWLQYRIFWLAQ
jgi:hypothetical protein